MFTSAVAAITAIVTSMTATSTEKRLHFAKLHSFMTFKRVPKKLQRRVWKYYEHVWSSGRLAESEVFEGLPTTLRTQLDLSFKSNLIKIVPLLHQLTPVVVVSVLNHLQPNVAVPDEVVIEEGEIGMHMFLVEHGKLMALHDYLCIKQLSNEEKLLGLSQAQHHVYIELGLLTVGDHFGEGSLLREDHIAQATVRATTFCDLMALHLNHFNELLGFKEFRDAVMSQNTVRNAISNNMKKVHLDRDRSRRMLMPMELNVSPGERSRSS